LPIAPALLPPAAAKWQAARSALAGTVLHRRLASTATSIRPGYPGRLPLRRARLLVAAPPAWCPAGLAPAAPDQAALSVAAALALVPAAGSAVVAPAWAQALGWAAVLRRPRSPVPVPDRPGSPCRPG